MDNTTILIGNLTRDPELRSLPTGQVSAVLGVAVNRAWTDRQTGDRREAVAFFDVVCWRDLAENVVESLARGDRVLVSGRLEQRSWEDPDGNRHSKIEIVADDIGPSLRWANAEISKNEPRPSGATAARADA